MCCRTRVSRGCIFENKSCVWSRRAQPASFPSFPALLKGVLTNLVLAADLRVFALRVWAGKAFFNPSPETNFNCRVVLSPGMDTWFPNQVDPSHFARQKEGDSNMKCLLSGGLWPRWWWWWWCVYMVWGSRKELFKEHSPYSPSSWSCALQITPPGDESWLHLSLPFPRA